MRIKCPECQTSLDFGTPKSGKYRPRCKHCGHSFFLKVSEDTPPKVGIARDPKSVSTINSLSAAGTPAVKPAESVMVPEVKKAYSPSAFTGVAAEATMDSIAPSGAVGSVTAKSPSSVSSQNFGRDKTQAGAMDETVEPSSAVQATMDTAISMGSKPMIKSGATASTAATEDAAMPARLGGYKLLRTLGRGAMGAVYEAKQLSLDRTVALKTIRDRLAGNPSALARFTREAYAAAQLNHHNVVQIYDFGEEAGQHYFSMERVVGSALDDVVRSKGPVEARVAATYVLQAARGLQCAHQSGMVHRDVKPANLLLSDEGVVKVADLGLVKVPDQQEETMAEANAENSMADRRARSSGTSVTMMGTAIGTPAYMAPEQFSDATTVDHRADIYSLGCTLYYLIVGKPPYGASEISVLSKQHLSEPIPQVSVAHPHVPGEIDKIIERAMAKRASDRYPTFAGMITDLESFLGLTSGKTFAPSAAQADAWAANAEAFHQASPLSALRPLAILGLGCLSVLLLLLTPWLGLGWILLGPSCFIAAVVVSNWLESLQGESPVVDAVRQWMGSLRFFDWIYALGLVTIIAVVCVFAGPWLGVLVGAVLGAILGGGYHYGVRTPINTSRRHSLGLAEQMIRQFRVSGADEDGLRAFVARYSKRGWGELFDALFGVESRMKTQATSAGDPTIAKLTSSIRDRLIANLHERARKNGESRDQEKLSLLEQRALVSEGVSASEARDRAWQMAAVIIDSAKLNNEVSAVTGGQAAEQQAALAAEAKRQRIKSMMAEARSGKYAKKRDPLAVFKLLFGAQLRLAVGVGLLALLAVWAHRTGVISGEALQNISASLRQGDVKFGDVDFGDVSDKLKANAEAATLLGARLPSVALASLLLIGSAFVSGWRMTPFAIVAAGIALWGSHFGIPAIGPIPAYAMSAAAAIVLIVPGAMISERA